MHFILKIWRQANRTAKGKFVEYHVDNISPDASFLEMLDIVNEQLVVAGGDTIAFDHDCREGICGCCGLYINGHPHGAFPNTTTCQLHMRKFTDGETITIEPWRAKPFPVVKDLVVDRAALDKIIQAGGFVSCRTGNVPEANSIPIKKEDADMAMDSAACIGCGACVAACKNASAMLFVAAKVSQFALLPQGQIEMTNRVKKMVAKMDELGFGNCSNTSACSIECPKGISIDNIARLNRKYLGAKLKD